MFIPQESDCLLVVDVQYDFMPGGALAVPHGDEVVPVINVMARHFQHVVLTQDWHPLNHISFAKTPQDTFTTTQLTYGEQVLWPVHCVQATHGAALHAELSVPHAELVIRKGCNPQIDSYSAFVEADRMSKTGLAGYLHEKQVKRVVCVGLATDFCVAWSALDAVTAGFEAVVDLSACRAIDLNGSLALALDHLRQAGVQLINQT